MAVCHAFGQGGDARWPFARQRAGEMAVCQAMGHEMAVCRAKGRRPPDFGQVLLELGQSRVGG
eukprot:COSAG02_NODE_45709_length_354_cov_1.623529_1_plen_62_part_10